MFAVFSSRSMRWHALLVVGACSVLWFGCAKGSSDDAAAVAAAREAQIRAETELKILKEQAEKASAASPPAPAPEVPIPPAAETNPVQTQVTPQPAAPPANPLPDVNRIKADLIGRSISGGLLKKYQFNSPNEFLSFKVLNRQEDADIATFAIDTVLKKDASSTKRCFSTILVTYGRRAPTEAWAFRSVEANTLTCE
jgi:hypothetical protein